jgi:spoIIIJ-associated protein
MNRKVHFFIANKGLVDLKTNKYYSVYNMSENKLQKLIEEFTGKLPLDISEVKISLNEDTGAYWCAISSKDSRFFIGRDGDTLRAINYLLHRMIEKELPEGEKLDLIVDVNNYQKQIIDKLKAVAHMMAERARFFKSSVDVDPMSAFERKIIHEYIQAQDDLETESVGEGRDRHIVIKYKG